MFKNIIPDRIITGASVNDEGKFEIITETVQNDSFPRDFAAVNGNLFFVASTPYFMETSSAISTDDQLNWIDRDIIGGQELWFSDGTESGTRPIIINNNLYDYYSPLDVTYGSIPDNIDASDYGFTTNSASSFPRELTAFESKLVFVANDGNTGFELWAVSAEGDNVRRI